MLGRSVIFGLRQQARFTSFETIKYEKIGKVGLITLNRPKKLNAMNTTTYSEVDQALRKISLDDDLTVAAITGTGKYFTSGNDMGDGMKRMMESDLTPEEVSAQNTETFKSLVGTLIDFEKPLAALVNGPAIGIGVTVLPHADFVWSSDDATFRTPFTQIGLVPEACSSYLLPQVLGSANASEMLLFGTQFTAQELKRLGLVSRIFEKDDFMKKSMRLGKSLIKSKEVRDTLHQVNANECEVLATRYTSEEVIEAVMRFNSRK
ncbi:Oidioi.mRNA.OKI2018_I69.XSR.g15283.t1.cds [Oikopleura dioica]|uniref:Oidioi.mRNA.OKI2018_I69.XSR.g15283.t1.cds n=1 Tax=Oikopleura dioica TaxID=34765 RepID=A0ABN7SGC6_OIKDI|nr:Oidioi.mRNA.OKI2018_I69.XSR.g15283.t1.cds [Oikopleura dioica]